MKPAQFADELEHILNNWSKNPADYRADWGLDDMGDIQDEIPAVRKLYGKLFNLVWKVRDGE